MVGRVLLVFAALAENPARGLCQWKVDSSAVDPTEDRPSIRASIIADQGDPYQLTITCASNRTLIGVIEGTQPFMPTSTRSGATLTSVRVRYDKTQPVSGNLIISGTEGNVAGIGDPSNVGIATPYSLREAIANILGNLVGTNAAERASAYPFYACRKHPSCTQPHLQILRERASLKSTARCLTGKCSRQADGGRRAPPGRYMTAEP
jgi:hypothetical protein